MSRVVFATVCVAAVILVVSSSTARLRAGGTSACSITFSDRAGDLITSDGQGSYIDDGRAGGVNCSVGGANNIVLGLGRKTTRRFSGSYSGLVPGSAFVPDPPTGPFTDGRAVNIHDVASMAVGTRKLTQAHFGRDAQSNTVFMHWCGTSPDEPPCNYSWGSMVVSVTRMAKRTWVVTTDPPAGYEGIVGDEAVLADNTIAYPVALYHLPFQLTVDCPKCS